MATKRHPPTIRLRRLAAELRRLRAAAELTREVVSEKTGINGATLYRIENAQVRPQRRTLIALLELYKVDDAQRNALLELLADASQQAWLRSYEDALPDKYATYISFENEARSVSNFEPLVVPGLLQTEEYARAMMRGGLPTVSAKEIEQRIQARMDRKAVFAREMPLELWAIVDEAALRRRIGGVDVMREQLQYLVHMIEQPFVTLQVVPFDVGAHPAMAGSFVMMDFPGAEEPEVVYVETVAGDLFVEAEPDIRQYTKIFDNLRAVALSPDHSASLIAAVAEQAA